MTVDVSQTPYELLWNVEQFFACIGYLGAVVLWLMSSLYINSTMCQDWVRDKSVRELTVGNAISHWLLLSPCGKAWKVRPFFRNRRYVCTLPPPQMFSSPTGHTRFPLQVLPFRGCDCFDSFFFILNEICALQHLTKAATLCTLRSRGICPGRICYSSWDDGLSGRFHHLPIYE